MGVRFGITLATRDPLACRLELAVMVELGRRVAHVAETIAWITGLDVEPHAEDARCLFVQVTEPAELLLAGTRLAELRYVARSEANARITGIAASAPAAELLRDRSEPTGPLWQRFTEHLDVDFGELGDGPFIAVPGIGVHTDPFCPAPLALRFPDPTNSSVFRAALFVGSQVTIGRGDEPVDIAIRHATIARQHCAFVRRSSGWVFRDLDSGRCFFDGKRIETMPVVGGDVFALGEHALEVIAAM